MKNWESGGKLNSVGAEFDELPPETTSVAAVAVAAVVVAVRLELSLLE